MYQVINLFRIYVVLFAKLISFVIVENNKCVGICFLPIENFISLAEGYTISPLSIEKRIYELIEQIVKEFNVLKVKFYLDPLILEYTNKFNYLLEYCYIVCLI